LLSRTRLVPAIEKHVLYAAEVQSGGLDAAVTEMRSHINVDAKYRNESAEALEVTYENQDPALAAAVLSELLSAFTDVNATITEQLAAEESAVRDQIAEVDARLGQLGRQSAAAAVGERQAMRALDAQNAERMRLKAEASTAEVLADRTYVLQQQLAEQDRQIEEQRKVVAATAASNPVPTSGSYGVLLVRKAELEAQLKEYSSQYTEKNPKVVQTKTQLAAIEGQISDFREKVPDVDKANASPEAGELRAMERERGRLGAELEVTRRALDRKQSAQGARSGAGGAIGESAIGSADAPAVEYDRLNNHYSMLVNRQAELRRLQSSAAYGSGFFQLIEPPSVPQLPAGPNRLKLYLTSLAVALAAAVALGLALEVRRLPMIHDSRDVEFFLGVPVLAQIPETVVTAERGGRRSLLLTRRAELNVLVAAACAAVISIAGLGN
jgi:succinoglycan biosynthesis transport protein ExoP